MSNIRMKAIYQQDPNIVNRDIAGEMILVPIRNNVSDMSSIYTLNKSAAMIWKHIDGHQSLENILQILVNTFDISPVTLEQDLIELINELLEINAVIEISE